MERKELRQKNLELVDNIRKTCGSEGLKYLIELIENNIEQYHFDNEDNKGEEFLITQGKIKGHRELLKSLYRNKKS